MEKVFIEGDLIYLKKSNIFGWIVVHPYKKDDGSIDWFNLITGGSKANLFMWLFITLIIVGVIIEYTNNINHLVSCFDNLINLENCKQVFGGSNLKWIR